MSPLVESFFAYFGEMGSRWGINRTAGQVYALLFVSEAPLNADDIGETLGISRSNVSMSLKELEAWKLVRLTRKPGDRRGYYGPPGSPFMLGQKAQRSFLARSVKLGRVSPSF